VYLWVYLFIYLCNKSEKDCDVADMPRHGIQNKHTAADSVLFDCNFR